MHQTHRGWPQHTAIIPRARVDIKSDPTLVMNITTTVQRQRSEVEVGRRGEAIETDLGFRQSQRSDESEWPFTSKCQLNSMCLFVCVYYIICQT